MYKINDVAKRANVAKSTVSNYLNGRKIRESNRLRIDEAIKELNYHPNIIARGLKNLKGFTVGVLVSSLSESFSNIILSNIENYLQEKNYAVIVCSTENDLDRQADKVKFLIDRNIDGAVILSSVITEKELALFDKRNIPYVLVDKYIEELECDSVTLDNIAAVKVAVQYLAEKKHSKIAIITGQDEYSSVMRREGYRQAMAENGLTYNPCYIISEDYTIQGGYNGLNKILNGKLDVTAAIITNYEMSAGFIMAANELDVKIPDKISIIGFDNLNLASLVKPRLTMVSQPMEKMGYDAADIIFKRIHKDYGNYPYNTKYQAIMEEGESVKKL